MRFKRIFTIFSYNSNDFSPSQGDQVLFKFAPQKGNEEIMQGTWEWQALFLKKTFIKALTKSPNFS